MVRAPPHQAADKPHREQPQGARRRNIDRVIVVDDFHARVSETTSGQLTFTETPVEDAPEAVKGPEAATEDALTHAGGDPTGKGSYLARW